MHVFAGLLLACCVGGYLCLRTPRIQRVVAQLRLLRRSMRKEFQRLESERGVELLMERRSKKATSET